MNGKTRGGTQERRLKEEKKERGKEEVVVRGKQGEERNENRGRNRTSEIK